MCYKGNCLYISGIPIEKGCLALAILSAVASGLALVTSVILGILTAAGIIFVSQEVHHSGIFFDGHNWGGGGTGSEIRTVIGGEEIAGVPASDVIIFVALASLIGFIFSVLLCNGIFNRRPGQVIAYFVYGVVITVLTALASVILLAFMKNSQPGILGLFGCVVYSLFLVLVHRTYSKLSDDAALRDHIRLVES